MRNSNAVERRGYKSGSVIVSMDRVAPRDKTLLIEDLTMTYYDDPKLRINDIADMDRAITDVTFGDSPLMDWVFASVSCSSRTSGIMTDLKAARRL